MSPEQTHNSTLPPSSSFRQLQSHIQRCCSLSQVRSGKMNQWILENILIFDLDVRNSNFFLGNIWIIWQLNVLVRVALCKLCYYKRSFRISKVDSQMNLFEKNSVGANCKISRELLKIIWFFIFWQKITWLDPPWELGILLQLLTFPLEETTSTK